MNLCACTKDGWTWRGESGKGFTAKSVYEVLKERAKETTEVVEETDISAKVWKIPIPNKVKLTVWRILKNRIPTCDNLLRRNVMLSEVEVGCNACFYRQESMKHVLLHCPKTSKIWEAIYQWLGVCVVQPHDVPSHFRFFTGLSSRKSNRKFLMALWCCTTWLIWKMRNESRFDNKRWEIASLLGEIKARVWSWGKIFGFVNDGVGMHRWMSSDESPLTL
ncbi:uncharacterized protein LOC131009459 [Salvia miltiorrhiza]|uniref:uncharacterized protein LOC131009459 n=1 Tax=Salvia miltiorrhiza TaxID=226208 RepID=UPI0025AD3B4E|nr:uncharacterized protein LOC131009459 [Salvia miltiorrhiza]